jgi:hypothetical protein
LVGALRDSGQEDLDFVIGRLWWRRYED